MRPIPALVIKDLLRRARAPLGICVVLSFPILFSLMLALTFGTGSDDPPRIRLLVENHDEEFIGEMLISVLSSARMAERFEVDVVGEDGERLLSEVGAAALLRIPASFTDRVLEGTPVALHLVRNPSQGIMPEITEQLTGVLVEVLDVSSRVLRAPLEQLDDAWQNDSFSMTDPVLTDTVLAVKETLQGAGRFAFPPVILLDVEQPENGRNGNNMGFGAIFLAILPGISVYALFLVGDLGMRDLLAEKQAGTLRRQLCGPIRAGTLIFGKVVSTGVLCIISIALLTLIGSIISPRRVSTAGFVFLSLAMILAVTGVASILYGAARSQIRGSTIGSILYLTLAFAGGSFITFESLPSALRSIAPLSPFYWGTMGFRTLLRDGGGAGEVLLPAAILSALGLATLLGGSILLQRQVRGEAGR